MKDTCLIAAWLVLIAPGGWRAYDEFPKALAREFGMRRPVYGDAAQKRLRKTLDMICGKTVVLGATIFALDGPDRAQVLDVGSPGWCFVCEVPQEYLDRRVPERTYFLVRLPHDKGAPVDSLVLQLSGGGEVVLLPDPKRGGR